MNQPIVLAIDDSQDIHDILYVRLKPEDVVLHRAMDARDGLDKARELLPDLILLDIDMPDMSGLELCHHLKNDPRTGAIPIIFLTGAADLEVKVQGFDLGAIDYVTKPFQPAELRARVRAALRTKRYHDLLARRAQIDGLTGLWNRHYFDRRMEEETAAVQRYGRVLSLILVDVDHFKKVNDSYGHPFGDRVLQNVGEVLHAQLRTVDAPCRYGGEEFGIILTQTDLAGAHVVAERLRAAIARIGLGHRGATVTITASFGISSSELVEPPNRSSVPMLVELADQALYAAKQAGRNRVIAAARRLAA
jgi:two-component system cell cycle response regulator